MARPAKLSAWRAEVAAVRCPSCAAEPGHQCREAGRGVKHHEARALVLGNEWWPPPAAAAPVRPRRSRSSRPSPRSSVKAPSGPAWLLVPDAMPSWQLGDGGPRHEVLLRDVASPFKLALLPRAYETLVEEASRSVDGHETGGVALGFYDAMASIVITDIAGPGANAVRKPLTLVPDPHHDTDMADAIAAELGGELIEVASWHTHPGSAIPRPSGPDMQRGATMLLMLERKHRRLSCFSELIVVPDRDGSWSKPRIGAWVTRRDPDRDRFVCEPAAELRGLE